MKMRDAANSLRTVGIIKVRDASNALRTVGRIRMRDASNVLRELSGTAGGLSASASPPAVVGYGSSTSSIRVTTAYTSVSVAGGTAPLTYSWPAVGGWTATSPTSPTTAFRSPLLGGGDESYADFVCTVTDALGNSVATNAVSVFAENNGGLS